MKMVPDKMKRLEMLRDMALETISENGFSP